MREMTSSYSSSLAPRIQEKGTPFTLHLHRLRLTFRSAKCLLCCLLLARHGLLRVSARYDLPLSASLSLSLVTHASLFS